MSSTSTPAWASEASGASGAPVALHVVVPCRDEAEALPAHLDALAAAVEVVRRLHPSVAVSATVVLDTCRDASAEVVRHHRETQPWLHAVEVRRGRVGAVRGDGVAHARRLVAAPAARTWLAHTDADSQVPAHWLLHHVAAARRGLDLWLGTVRPAAPDDVVARWGALHALGPGHRHVHGANLGVRLAAYDEVGGFGGWSTGEDVDLVRALCRRGARVGADDLAPVLTSARLVGRAPDGFATFLASRHLVKGW